MENKVDTYINDFKEELKNRFYDKNFFKGKKDRRAKGELNLHEFYYNDFGILDVSVQGTLDIKSEIEFNDIVNLLKGINEPGKCTFMVVVTYEDERLTYNTNLTYEEITKLINNELSNQ